MTQTEINLIKKKLKDSFNELKFDHKTHTYTIAGDRFESVTTTLKNYSKGFDTYNMAALVAEKYNRENPDKPPRNSLWYVKHWKLKNEEISARGSRVHYYAEQYPNLDEPTCDQERGIKEWYDALDSKYVILHMELQMYCKKLRLAGTADLILLNTETGKLVIADWKTNSTPIFQVYNKTKLKKPFSKYYDNSYNKYILQLSYYQMLIENNTDFEVEDRWLIWLRGDDYQTLPDDKNPDRYHIQKVNATVKAEFYKQFNVEDRIELINKYIEDKKTTDTKKIKKTSSSTPLFSSKMLRTKSTAKQKDPIKELKEKMKAKKKKDG